MWLYLETNYPWDGKVKLNIDPEKKSKFILHLRIPGWARHQPVPGNLYSQLMDKNSSGINHKGEKRFEYNSQNDYILIDREWKKGDVVEYDIPMDIYKMTARSDLKSTMPVYPFSVPPSFIEVKARTTMDMFWNLSPPKHHFTTEVNTMFGKEPVIAFRQNPLGSRNGEERKKKKKNTHSLITQHETTTHQHPPNPAPFGSACGVSAGFGASRSISVVNKSG